MTKTVGENIFNLHGEALINKITDGIEQSRYIAVRDAIIHGTPLVCWQDGQVIEVDPRTIPLPPEFRPGYYEGPAYTPPTEK